MALFIKNVLHLKELEEDTPNPGSAQIAVWLMVGFCACRSALLQFLMSCSSKCAELLKPMSRIIHQTDESG